MPRVSPPSLGCLLRIAGKIDALFLAEVIDKTGNILGQILQELREGDPDGRSLFRQLTDEQAAIEIVIVCDHFGR